jgi:hypothetical protein
MKKPLSKRKNISNLERSERHKLNESLGSAAETLINYPHVKRLNRNLRRMFMLYVAHEKDSLSEGFESLILDMYFLHEFLDLLEDKTIDKEL